MYRPFYRSKCYTNRYVIKDKLEKRYKQRAKLTKVNIPQLTNLRMCITQLKQKKIVKTKNFSLIPRLNN